MIKTKTCEYCGQKFTPKYGHFTSTRFCSMNCEEKSRRQRYEAMLQERREKKKNVNRELIEIAKAAKAEGLSYGKYCVKHNLYDIVIKCNNNKKELQSHN